MGRDIRMRVVGGVLALGMLAAVAAPVGAGTQGAGLAAVTVPLGGAVVNGLGYNSVPAEADRAIAAAHKLHARIVRSELPWSIMSPRGPGQYEPRALAFTDRLVADAAANGIGVVLTVDGTPCWASAAPAALLRACVPGRPSKAGAWPPRNPADYATFVAFLAQRYGTRLAAIEIWNEPDQANQFYFAGPEKAQRYAAVLRAAYPAIKQVDPGVTVLGGSLVGSNGAFLRALYAAGIKGYYDGLSVHFYNLVLGSLRSIREVQLANGDNKPLWLVEFGWTSCWPHHRIQQEQACVTRQIQGLNLANTFRALARTSYIAAETVYKLQGSRNEDFGVLTETGGRKPSFADLSQVLVSPLGAVTRVSLGLRRQGASVVASGSGPVGDFMGLEAFEHGQLRFRALFTLDRFNRYSITLPAVLGTHGLSVRVFQYWAGRGRAARRSI